LPVKERPIPAAATTAPADVPALLPLLLTVEQTSQALAIGRTAVYELITNGRLGSVRIGGSRRIPVAALDVFMQRLIQEATPPQP
jgi:excisionase family DNA binding protein